VTFHNRIHTSSYLLKVKILHIKITDFLNKGNSFGNYLSMPQNAGHQEKGFCEFDQPDSKQSCSHLLSRIHLKLRT
jgi:hypothetical protein